MSNAVSERVLTASWPSGIRRATGFFVGLLASLFLLTPAAFAQIKGYFPKPEFDPNAVNVSMVQLIVNPQLFDGKKVRLIGFLRLEFEGDAVYFHREDFENGITNNGLWIDVPNDMTQQQRSETNMTYVICEGVFRAGRHGHMGLFAGEISDVTRLQLWTSHARSGQSNR
jgi:hypothetical protein